MCHIDFVSDQDNWSFKLVEDASNLLCAHSDYHLVLKDGSHDQSKQVMKDFYWIEENSVAHRRDTSIYKTKNWSHRVIFLYWTRHQSRDISKEGSWTWRWSNCSIKNKVDHLDPNRGVIRDCQSVGSPFGNRSSLGLMTCSGASDNTSIFTWTRGPLKINDQTGRTSHKDVGPNKQHMKSLIVTPG
jgi:hypothetical protein